MKQINIKKPILLGVALLAVSAGFATFNEVDVAQAGRLTATCANTSTDAATINAAINGSASGDEIVIEGKCLINATIKLKGDRTYRGQSHSGTVLKQANGANLATLVASDTFVDNNTWTGAPFTLSEIAIDGNKANNTSSATNCLVVRSWQSYVKDNQISNCGGAGIYLSNLSANGTALTNTQVNGNISGNFIENSGTYGIYNADTNNAITDWTVSDNWIGGSGITSIHLENAAGWMITGNHVYDNAQNGIYANRMYGSSITNNYVENFGSSATAGTYYGIAVTVQGDVASTIANNRVFNINVNESNVGSTYRYVAITQVNYNTGYVSVTGNAIRGAGTARGTGLYYSKGGGSALGVTTTGNNVSTMGTLRTVGTGVTVSVGI